MKVKKIYFVAASALTLMFGSCKDSESYYDTSGFTDALVQSFILSDNDSVADNLGDVFFAINQYGSVLPDNELTEDHLVGQIFNADSLPVGTKTDKLLAKITSNNVERLKLYTATDTTDYDELDTINFSKPVIMEVIAGDGVSKKFYEIKVNVHQLEGDSIHWMTRVDNPLPSINAPITAQRALQQDEQAFWFVEQAGTQLVATSAMNDLNTWETFSLNAGTALRIETVTSYADAFVALSQDGQQLMHSADGKQWNEVATNDFVQLIGTYSTTESNTLIALCQQAGETHFVYSTDLATWTIGAVIPSTFPISGFSNPIQYFGGTTERLVVAGGVTAQGQMISSFWNYEFAAIGDATPEHTWQEFTNEVDPFQQATLFPYTDIIGAALTTTSDRDLFWMLAGGVNAEGQPIKTVYYTPNKGVGLFEAPASYQAPAAFVARAASPILVGEDLNFNVLGGNNVAGQFENNIWKARLNKLVFKPIR